MVDQDQNMPATLPEQPEAKPPVKKGLPLVIALVVIIAVSGIASAFGSFSPFVDGYLLPLDVYTIFAEGKQHDVPVLVGSNSDEGTTLRGRPQR